MHRIVLAIVAVGLALAPMAASADDAPLWLRYPAISPDGSTIVFAFAGDLWKVPANGGAAVPLTLHEAYDTNPVWSPDGSTIAFRSDRYGNFDVFTIPVSGGVPTRLTYHSADDTPASFTPDGSAVLFESVRLDAASSAQFPSRRAQPELYRVALDGGMPTQVLTTPARYATFDGASARLAYSDLKGLEDEFRKHDTSSFTRDLWLWDVAANTHTRLTEFGYDDRQPVWSPDETALYFLSERSGSFNVWRLDVDNPSAAVQITDHTMHPVRSLSITTDGTLCYNFDGGIWTRAAGADSSQRLAIIVAADSRATDVEHVSVAREISEMDVSPDGDEIVFIARGEVFVTSAKHDVTRRITNTPEQERSVSFSPDGRSLLYAAERNGSWNLYRTDLTDDDELAFYTATAFAESPILEIEAETYQPAWSPDGKEVAYLEERTELKVINLDSKETRTILPRDVNYSYGDGDQWYQWSPDGQWFLVSFLSDGRWSSEAGLIAADGTGEVINLTKSGYEDLIPKWAFEGEAMLWLTDRHGMRRQAGYGSQDDVYVAFFTQEAWDRFRLTEAELELAKELEKKKKKDEKADKDDDEGDTKDKKKKDTDADDAEESEDEDGPKLADPVDIVVDGLEDRMARLTLHSGFISDAVLTPDGENLLFLARYDEGFDLWKYAHREKELERLAKLDADFAGALQLDKEGTTAFLVADRRLMTVEVGSGKVKPVSLSATLRLDPDAERAYMFEHVWRQTKKKFLVEDMHGVDWPAMKAYYQQFLPSIHTNWEYAGLLSEMLGELNASHTGSGFRPSRENADRTASLAFFPDLEFAEDGIKVLEIIEGSPLQQADSKIEPGVVITAIDGTEITAGMNWYPLLDRKADTHVRLTLQHDDDSWEETVKPISQRELGQLLYERWVRSRRAEVERLSDGRLGYAHIRSMNDRSYREIFEDIFGHSVGAEGIVLDTRFNSGGNLVEALTIFLSGEVYATAVPRGQVVGVEPGMRWTKPSIVVMNEGNYSDAHCFPKAYTDLELGETVGMPVPGTCTAVWWERLLNNELYFGIPQVGYLDHNGELLENQHLAPDHQVDNDPTLEAAGRDQQLETAVEVLLAEIDG